MQLSVNCLNKNQVKKNKNKDTFGEQYEVSLDYKKPDGYWVMSHKEFVVVPVRHGVNEKCNHDKAKEIAKQRFPGCRINCVTYL